MQLFTEIVVKEPFVLLLFCKMIKQPQISEIFTQHTLDPFLSEFWPWTAHTARSTLRIKLEK